jgi:hypothetical protein
MKRQTGDLAIYPGFSAPFFPSSWLVRFNREKQCE